MNQPRNAVAMPPFRQAKPEQPTIYLSFLNVPVLTVCIGSWAVLLLLGAAVAALI